MTILEKSRAIYGWMEDSAMEYLYNLAVNAPKNALIVEIGSWLGRSTSALYTGMRKDETVVAIDTWMGQDDLIFNVHSDVLYKDIFLEFIKNMEMFCGVMPLWYKKGDKGARYLRMDSEIAGQFFDDNSIDVLFLDADHKKIGRDIDTWNPKVKKDGIFCGHDYHWDGAKEQIEARFPVTLIDNVWTRVNQ